MLENYGIADEKRILKFWERENIYKADLKKKIFSIDTPPPTVSGKMHIGHAFSYSQEDFIARFRRMNGSVFYPFGTDDNGLPTERLVEKLNNVKSKKMSRADFIELCLKTLKEIRSDFVQDWKNLGISCDYNVYYSTIDKNSQKISQKSFLELYKRGEIYKKQFPTIWCPECQTAIAQAELEDKEQNTFFSTVKFSVSGQELLIATTRPELLPACCAIFVNPEDKRYKSFIGKKAEVPIFGQEVPIIADSSAEIDKGTGALMICSYGDKFDVDAVARHKLTPRVVLNKDGTLNLEGYEFKAKDARKKILKELKEQELVTEQKQIIHNVNVHDKCGTEIEFIETEQWFIRILDKKNKLLELGRKIKWHPEFMLKRYENWIQGLNWDWSISRDRHFGVPIPVWKCKKCDKIIIASENELPIDPLKVEKKCSCGGIAYGEIKVFDTWMTSSLTPQIAASLVSGIKLPYSLRPQAHDIIRTWAFYTIVKSYLHENSAPWKEIMISGFVTLQGEKMSKSKGNVIEPQEVLGKYGADALRFWAAGSKLGEDLNYEEKDLVTGKRLVNKIFNASKFALMNISGYKNERPKNLLLIDKWILAKLSLVIKNCTEFFSNYEYARARAEVENFFWHTLCDNYFEIIKNRVYQSEGEKKIAAQYALHTCLLNVLKLFAPIVPFVTEHVYQERFAQEEKCKSVHISKWPDFSFSDVKSEKAGDIFVELLSKVRQFKSENQKSMKAEVSLTIEKEKLSMIREVLDDFKAVCNATEILEGNFSVKFV